MTASRGSSRCGTAASSMPFGGAVGRSLRECTARSTSPRSSASRRALTKTPVPPIWASGAEEMSPSVRIITSSVGRPVAAVSASATSVLWVRASAEARVPMRMRVTGAVLGGRVLIGRPPGSTASTASGSSANSSASAAA